MAGRELNHKQQLFVEAYLGKANGNATEAARIAGYKQPHSQGPRLLENVEICSRVNQRVSDAGMTANEVLTELAAVGRIAYNDDPKAVQNKVRALELLGKHHKLFTEKQEVEHSGTVNGVTPTINVYASESKQSD